AIAFVIAATTFSLSAQALVIGADAAAVAVRLHASPGVLLIALMAHAPLELTALFLPLAAWIMASRRGEWDQLLAATLVTVVIALPMLFAAACIEVFVSPHILHALLG
ncbi:MAG: stage II sporulation protein M, partial [Solirubrobacteraceae bacterium]